jgi:hypothetical protein
MFQYLSNWLAGIEKQYGVNPIVFAVIYFAGVIPFWLSIYKIVAGLRSKNLVQVRTFGIILAVIIIAPFTYVAVFGRNLPVWFWFVAAGVIGYTCYSVFRRIKSTRI